MKQICIFILLLSVTFTKSIADESFSIIAADPKHKRVLNVSVSITRNQVTLKHHDSHALSFRPTGITKRSDNKQLYVSGSNSDGGSTVVTLGMISDGSIQLVHESSISLQTGYTSLDRTGRYFLSSNYRTGDVGVHLIENDGRLGTQVCSVKTPKTEAHCIWPTPDNRFAYVPCVKLNNALYQYSFDQESGKLTPLEPFNAHPPAMFGPRHVGYHPTLPIAYFSNEQQLGVSVYGIQANGQLRAIQHAVTMPRRSPYVKGERGRHASDLVVSPDGKRLFVAVRDFVGDDDSVFTFRIEDDGRLSQIARSKVGDIPWKIDLSPSAKQLVVSESGDNIVSIYAINEIGELSKSASLDWDASIRDMVVVQAK